jgi:hypothetical protein
LTPANSGESGARHFRITFLFDPLNPGFLGVVSFRHFAITFLGGLDGYSWGMETKTKNTGRNARVQRALVRLFEATERAADATREADDARKEIVALSLSRGKPAGSGEGQR